jgi:threonine/homoserine/homoserine lactone efflux protein
MELFLTFLGVSALVIVSPGPDTALTTRNTLFGGRVAGIFTALGVSLGLAIWTLATSAGLVALLVASEPLFLAVKYAGAAYLIFLGAQALWSAARHRGADGTPTRMGAAAPTRLRPMLALRQGLISNLGNPKIAVFFASLLPQFAPGGHPTFAGLLLLGLSFVAMTLAWLVIYAAAVARAGDLLRRSSVRRALEGITGAVLIGLGLRLATEQR